VRNSQNLHFYEADLFEYDSLKVMFSPTIIKPESIKFVEGNNSANDVENSIRIFEAYKNLTPLEASDTRLWTYLAHVDFYPYMITRWPSVKNKTALNSSKYILDHWFIASTSQSNLLRHGIASLWWIAYLTYDEAREDYYELTRLIYKTLDVPTRTLGTYKLARHREAVIGILEFIQQNPVLFANRYQDKLRFITKYLNLIGGTKPISYFKRDFFKNSLQGVRTKIESI
jgi:hypothetical protein